jgi:hypothetical protein
MMKWNFRITGAVLLLPLFFVACSEQPGMVEPSAPEAAFSAVASSVSGSATVWNSGEGKEDIACRIGTPDGPVDARTATFVVTPKGKATLSCSFSGLPPIARQTKLTGFYCDVDKNAIYETRQSQWVRTTGGNASLTCQFNDKPFNDAMVVYEGGSAAAQQGASFLSARLQGLPGQRLSADVVYIGRACNGVALLADPAGKVALIERGHAGDPLVPCFFSDKLQNAEDAGAIAVIVYNNNPSELGLLTMGSSPFVDIPAVFVTNATGETLKSKSSVSIIHCGRSMSCKGQL